MYILPRVCYLLRMDFSFNTYNIYYLNQLHEPAGSILLPKWTFCRLELYRYQVAENMLLVEKPVPTIMLPSTSEVEAMHFRKR